MADDSVNARTARKTWRALEAYHGMIYFAPEAFDRYKALGIRGPAGYFGSRAAALGPVPAELVIATFYNFNPELIRSAIPQVWRVAAPEELLVARLGAADATLRRLLGSAVIESAELERAAGLVRRAAEAVAGDVQGRPLYAAHSRLPWPEEPHLVLWHAQTLLREYRGDGHVAALLTAGLSGIEALVTHAASGTIAAQTLRNTRAWSEQAWEGAIAGLQRRGLLEEGPDLTFTEPGRQLRQQVEDTTDQLATAPYEALGTDACLELQALAGPLTEPLINELMPWLRAVT